MKFSTTLFVFIALTLMMHKAKSSTDTWFDSVDGTVTDVATTLVWQQLPEPITSFNYSQAIAHCQALNLANKSDWRLPHIKELISIVDYRKSDRAQDRDFGVGAVDGYWSVTPKSDDATRAWLVDFRSGRIRSPEDKTSFAAVRCVRNQQ